MRCHPRRTARLTCSAGRQHGTLYRKILVFQDQEEYRLRCNHCGPILAGRSLSTAACGGGDEEKCLGEKDCTDVPTESSSENSKRETDEAVGSWFARCISIIGFGALLSKVLGLVREQLISSYLGLTGLADAFNLASTFPVLCLTGIGGLNGALHSATASTAAQLSQSNGTGRTASPMLEIVSVCNTRLGLATCACSLVLAVAANPAVQIIAPGLSQEHHAAAVIMLRIMSPVLILSGWIGVSLGALVSQKRIFAPSLVPVIGNVAFIGILLSAPSIGPVQLGLASLGSAVAQWVLLSGAMACAGFPMMVHWGGQAAGRTFGQLIGAASPVLLTTCALHGAAWTDLAVASYVPGAAASMSYAYILGLAPYGIIAGSVLTPLLRSLSMSDEKAQLHLLQVTVCSLARIMMPMAVLISCMAPHLVTIALSGGVFAAAEVSAVAQLIPLVQASALFGVLRDVLMRVHYVRGTSWHVLQLHVLLLVANLALDVAALGVGLGAYGLLASTVLINVSACVLVWGAVVDAPEKMREFLTGLGKILVTGAMTVASWLFAVWVSPLVLHFILSCLGGVSGGELMLGETLSRTGAALACAAFSVPMAVSYVTLYGAWYLFFQRRTLKRQHTV